MLDEITTALNYEDLIIYPFDDNGELNFKARIGKRNCINTIWSISPQNDGIILEPIVDGGIKIVTLNNTVAGDYSLKAISDTKENEIAVKFY